MSGRPRRNQVSLLVKLAIVACVVLAIVWVLVYSSNGPDVARPQAAAGAPASAVPSAGSATPSIPKRASPPALPSSAASHSKTDARTPRSETKVSDSGRAESGHDTAPAERREAPSPSQSAEARPARPAEQTSVPPPRTSAEARPPTSLTGHPSELRLPRSLLPAPAPPLPSGMPAPEPLERAPRH